MFKIIQRFSFATSVRPQSLPMPSRYHKNFSFAVLSSRFLNPSFQPIRNFHSTIAPQVKRGASVNAEHFDEDLGIYKVNGTEIPPEFSHFFSDPEGTLSLLFQTHSNRQKESP